MFEIKEKSSLEIYENVSDEIKYISNSFIRLDIVETLFSGSKTMKEINSDTGLSYSSISSNIHNLELGGYVFREFNKYHLSNIMYIYFENILDFKKTIITLNKLRLFFNNHCVNELPKNAILNLFLLKNSYLLESDEINIYKTRNFILDSLDNATYVKGILPNTFSTMGEKLNELVSKNKDVELLISDEIYSNFCQNIDLKPNLKVNSFKNKSNFSLLITDEVIMLSLFRLDGIFDQNRLLISKTEGGKKWANILFEEFKNKIK
ncbi:MAG: DUF1724 domain-containing protein [Methanobrevibacter woesei]|uniref:helix-turn-helix transcriptional regulator n=1 Tax=Methanobrevibacter woesei TaxID=190976 RepID=UPI0023F0ED12|nr:transcriptional regulator FilR1 domain-containing protein [Methanobrevibacter woesei]MCI7291720.1 DUF1724 domain-containing protein [Methanobrevibacter woesei]